MMPASIKAEKNNSRISRILRRSMRNSSGWIVLL